MSTKVVKIETSSIAIYQKGKPHASLSLYIYAPRDLLGSFHHFQPRSSNLCRGWPFSTSAHGWPISDCTSEGLKAAICLLKTNTIKEGIANNSLKDISEERLQKAINVLLTYQNEDGGWATYENNRGKYGCCVFSKHCSSQLPFLTELWYHIFSSKNLFLGWGWYEQLNPSEVFGDIMIDYSYVECRYVRNIHKDLYHTFI